MDHVQIKKKRAFTLIELMAVVIILGIITTLTVTSVNYSIKTSRYKLYLEQIKRLEAGVSAWATNNSSLLPTDSEGIVFFSVSRLKDEGIIDSEIIIDPRNESELDGCMTIKYDNLNQQYEYKYEEASCSITSSFYEPQIFISGADLQYAEVNGFFEIPDAYATDYNGKSIEVEGPIIYKGTNMLTDVDLSILGDEYRLVYNALDTKLNLRSEKEVIIRVRDTISPIIVCGGSSVSYTYPFEAAETFIFPTCTVSDNSCGITGIDTGVNGCTTTLNLNTSTSGLNSKIPGTYPIYYTATDSSSNIRVFVVNVVVNDTVGPTEPTYNVYVGPTGTTNYNGTWTSSMVRITDLNAIDAGSGVKNYRYADYVSGSCQTWTELGSGITSFTLDTDMDKEICIGVIDNSIPSNATTSPNRVIVKIDKIPPTIEFSSPSFCSSSDISVGITSTDTGGSSYKETRHAWSLGTTKPASGWSSWNTTGNYSATQTGAGVWYLHVEANDNANNQTYSYSGPYTKGSNPVINGVSGNPTEWTNQDVTLNIDMTTSCGNHATPYSFDGGTTWQAGNTSTFFSNQTVSVRVRDVALNIASSSVVINRIDKTIPTISVAGNPTSWQSSDVTLTVTASDANSGLHATAPYSFDGGATWQAGNTSTFTSNQTVNIRVRDVALNIASSSVVINRIDKTVPTISVSGNPTSWQTTDVTLTVTASDTGSGLHATAPYSFNGGTTWQAGNTSIFSSNQTVEVRVRDVLGNIASSSVVINRIDKAAPTIAVSGNPTAWQNTDVTLTVTSSDAGSGLHATPYSFNGGTTWQAGNTSIFTSNQTVNIRVRDVLGNIASSSAVITLIDKTTPEPLAVSASQSTWYRVNTNFGLSYRDNESGLAHYRFAWSNVLNAACTSGGTLVTLSGNSSITNTTVATKPTATGQHTLYTCAVNRAGGVRSYSYSFWLDATVPSWVTTPTKPTCLRYTIPTFCSFSYIYRLTNLQNLATDANSGLSTVNVSFGGSSKSASGFTSYHPSNSLFNTVTFGTITRTSATDMVGNVSGSGTNVTSISCSDGGSMSVCDQ
jgi:prepilin-type N-terminal cleavage/methylation domain-containing protein